MTQEQKQFIIKVLESGIPALAKEHIEAIEEVARVSNAAQEELNGQEGWLFLNQIRHENILNTIQASIPFMADEYISAYFEAVNASQAKFNENIKARQEKEAAEKKVAEKASASPAEKKKKSA